MWNKETPSGEVPSRFVHNMTRPTQLLFPKESLKALERLNIDFPHGYAMVKTSGKGLMCGINALSASLAHKLEKPDNEINAELQKLLEHPEYQDMCKTAGFSNQDNFHIDQLAMLVKLFGHAHGMKDMVLGFILADSQCYMYPGPVSEESRWVWISSSSKTGVTDPLSLDHYEGIVASKLGQDPFTSPTAATLKPATSGILVSEDSKTKDGMEVQDDIEWKEDVEVQDGDQVTDNDGLGTDLEQVPLQEEAIMPINSETNAKAVYEPVPSSTTYFTFNGKAYGIDTDSALQSATHGTEHSPKYTLKAFTREPNLRGLISVRGEIDRDTLAADNPTHQPRYNFYLEANLMHVTDMKYNKPGTWEVKAFIDPGPFGLLTITAKSIRMSNGTVPTLKDTAAEERLRAQNNAIASCNASFTFQFLLRYEESDGLPDVLSTVLQYKWEVDTTTDQMKDWIKDSGNKQQLLIGNIMPPLERPGLTQDNLVLALRRTHADSLEFKVFSIYSLHIEDLFSQAIAANIASRTMATAITQVPGSAFATNLHDNTLPKLYRLSVRWPQDVDRPKVGDKFETVMPFDAGQCPAWTGPPVKRSAPKFFDDFDEGDEIITGQSAEQKEDDAWERSQEYKQHRRKVWSVFFWGSDDLTVPGETTMWAERPSDTLWEGPADLTPTVPTEVPVHEHRFHTKSRYIEIVKSQATRHDLSFILVSSHQTYKDMVRCIDGFAGLEAVESNPSNAAQHLLKLIISGDLQRNPFRVRNLLNATDGSLFTRLTRDLTDYQRGRLNQTLSNVEHGIALIKGCPAAAKTVMLEITALLLLTHKQVPCMQELFVTDTNAGVNDIASRLDRRASQAGMQDVTIVRLHSLDGEISRFIARRIQGYGSARPRFQGGSAGAVVVPALIDVLGSAHEGHKTDKRYDQNIVNLDLNASLARFCTTKPDDEDVAALKTKISDFKGNADAGVMTEINGLVRSLIGKVLANANVVVTTCSLAIQNGVSSRFSPRYIFKDEDCRSWPQYFYALAGAYYGSVDTFFVAGDPVQKKPYIGSETCQDSVNPFVRELGYTIFQRFEDMGIKVYPFYEQHRMHNKSFVKYISEHHYMDAIVDGTLLRPLPPQADFMRRFHQETYGIDSNIMVMVTHGARAHRIEGGTSLFNNSHAAIAEHYIQALEAYVLAQKPSFPASDLFVLYLSTYLGQVAEVTRRIQQHSLNAEAKTIEVCQGLQRGVCVRDILNTKLSVMAGNKRDCLVADTRFQYGYVVIVTAECLDNKTYDLPHQFRMFYDPRTQHVYGLYNMALKHKWVKEMDTPSGMLCKVCNSSSHLASDCPERKACLNCGSLDHKHSKCDASFKTQFEVVESKKDNRPCRRCGEVGHLVAGCPLPWCRVCSNTSHAYVDCPKAACKKCHNVGHWPDNPLCPKYQTCKKCGGAHLAKTCQNVLTKTFALSSAKPAALNLALGVQKVFDFMDSGDTKDEVANAGAETNADPAWNNGEDTNDGAEASGKSNNCGGGWDAAGGDVGNLNNSGGAWDAGDSNNSGGGWDAAGGDAGKSNNSGSGWDAAGGDVGNLNNSGGGWDAAGVDAGKSNNSGGGWDAAGGDVGNLNNSGGGWDAAGNKGGSAGW